MDLPHGSKPNSSDIRERCSSLPSRKELQTYLSTKPSAACVYLLEQSQGKISLTSSLILNIPNFNVNMPFQQSIISSGCYTADNDVFFEKFLFVRGTIEGSDTDMYLGEYSEYPLEDSTSHIQFLLDPKTFYNILKTKQSCIDELGVGFARTATAEYFEKTIDILRGIDMDCAHLFLATTGFVMGLNVPGSLSQGLSIEIRNNNNQFKQNKQKIHNYLNLHYWETSEDRNTLIQNIELAIQVFV